MAWHADGRGDRVASEEGWRLERERHPAERLTNRRVCPNLSTSFCSCCTVPAPGFFFRLRLSKPSDGGPSPYCASRYFFKEQPRTLPAIPFCPPANRLPCENKVPRCHAAPRLTSTRFFFSSSSAHRARAICNTVPSGTRGAASAQSESPVPTPWSPTHLRSTSRTAFLNAGTSRTSNRQPVSHPPPCLSSTLDPLGSLMLCSSSAMCTQPRRC